MELKNVKLIEIIEPEIQMRTNISQAELNELTQSIMEVGLINPITLKKKGRKYEIIAGHKRFLALRQLQFTEIDCNVMHANEMETFQIRMDENLIRSNVTEIEEAIYIESAMKQTQLTQIELANKIGKWASYVNERLMILDYDPILLNALKEQKISFSVARELNRIKDVKKQREFVRFAITGGCTAELARQWAKATDLTDYDSTDRDSNDSTDTIVTDIIQAALFGECEICGDKLELPAMSVMRVCINCKNQLTK